MMRKRIHIAELDLVMLLMPSPQCFNNNNLLSNKQVGDQCSNKKKRSQLQSLPGETLSSTDSKTDYIAFPYIEMEVTESDQKFVFKNIE